MQFRNLLQAKVDNEIIYFDGDGLLYEQHPTRSHYTPTGKFVYYEYYGKPIFILALYTGAVGAVEFDVDYEINDEQQNQLKKGEKHNGSK